MLIVVALTAVAVVLGVWLLDRQPVAVDEPAATVEYHCVSERGCDGLFYLADDAPLGTWVRVEVSACVVETHIDGGVWLAMEPANTGACREG